MALYTWDGSSWILAPEKKIWNGSSWINIKGSKIWNGSSWKEYLNLEINDEYLFYSFGGGKGTAAYSLSFDGFSSISGTYKDKSEFITQSYSTFGTKNGDLRGYNVIQCWWSFLSAEDSSTGYYEKTINISVEGDISGTPRTLYVDNQSITDSINGIYNSDTNLTTFKWFFGTQPNTGGTPWPGGNTVPDESPFGGTGTSNDGIITNSQLL